MPFDYLKIPTPILSRADMTMEAKVLWARLKFAGDVQLKVATMARELGLTVRVVERRMGELRRLGLIRTSSGGRGKGARVEVISPPREAEQRGGSGGNSPPREADKEPQYSANSGRTSPPREAEQSAAVLITERRILKGIISSSSSVRGGTHQALTTTNKSSIEGGTPNSEPGHWWTPDEFEGLRRVIAAHRFGRPIAGPTSRAAAAFLRDKGCASAEALVAPGEPMALPDQRIAARVLRHLTDAADALAWIGSLPMPKRGIGSWGFYEADARDNWPGRRADAIALEAERTRAATAAEASAAEAEERCAEAERARAAAEGLRRREAARCSRCADHGAVEAAGSWRWCECGAGDNLREAQPQYVAEANRNLDALRRRFA